jgi:hypothetical protein
MTQNNIPPLRPRSKLSRKRLDQIIISIYTTMMLGSVALAHSEMTSTQYRFLEKNLEIEYVNAMVVCKSFVGSTRERCMSDATNNRNQSHEVLKGIGISAVIIDAEKILKAPG